MVIRMLLTMVDYAVLPRSSPERKVLQWNWYLFEFLCDQDMVAKRSVPSHTEEIVQLSVTPIPKPLMVAYRLGDGMANAEGGPQNQCSTGYKTNN